MGSQIKIFLSLVSTGIYGVESRKGITIDANALEDKKEYLVCDDLKKRIDTAVAQLPRKRKCLLSPASIITTNMNTTTRLKVTFAANDDADDDTLEVHTVFDDDVEDEREIRGHQMRCFPYVLCHRKRSVVFS